MEYALLEHTLPAKIEIQYNGPRASFVCQERPIFIKKSALRAVLIIVYVGGSLAAFDLNYLKSNI